eukprot:scaffold24490_cov101-Isochrysis_galbana.AAC.1
MGACYPPDGPRLGLKIGLRPTLEIGSCHPPDGPRLGLNKAGPIEKPPFWNVHAPRRRALRLFIATHAPFPDLKQRTHPAWYPLSS